MKLTAIAITVAAISITLSGCLAEVDSQEHPPHGPHGVHKDKHDPHLKEHDVGEPEAHGHAEGEGHHAHKILVTSPVVQDVDTTQPYVCQIHSCKHIEVKALEGGYLQEICVNEGQAVKKGDLMFQILPVLYQARLDSEIAERDRIQIEMNNAQSLRDKGIVSPQEIAIKKADLAKAQAKVKLAQAELAFASVKAPFDGIVDRQRHQLGSLVEESEVLTTLSDNSVMWVYFNVPEARYFEYKSELEANGDSNEHLKIELKLANGSIFPQPGKIGAIEADFNNTTGNISFRADFANPGGLLRNGQTGTILIHRISKNVVVIPQRSTFEILDKQYVFVVDENGVVHQRDIKIHSVQDDIFVIEKGVEPGEKIILEGARQVHDGEKIKYEFRAPEDVMGHLKYHAE